MKNRFITIMLLLVFLVTLTGNAQAIAPASTDKPALVYVDLSAPGDLSRFTFTHLPMFSMLDGGLLTGANRAGQQSLQEAGLSFQVLDPDLHSGSYYQAETRSSRPAPDFAAYGQVLFKTANGVLLLMDSARVDALTQAGAEVRLITLTPKPIPTAQSETTSPDVVVHDPLIQIMIDQVISDTVNTYDRQLAGELPVWVDEDWYTITSRYTYSGVPIQKATSYVGQHMQDLGLDVEYHKWEDVTYPNVIGEIPGLINPENIYIIGAHIDDVSGTPGADDNASGSVATLLAADIMSHYQWGCTLRFAFWTGEEQGLNGSYAYAQRARQNNENILGYLNLDMIAWNTLNSAPGIDLYYSNSVPGSLAFAQLFADVVSAYQLDLVPGLGTGETGSDHYSFWQFSYNSILAIEDEGDFNPHYHQPGDTPANNNLAYFTEFVKASIATYAHKSDCLIPDGLGALRGTVTAESGGAAIEGATVTADNGQNPPISATTDDTGYYTRTLLADTYTVTVSAYSYLPSTISGVVITSDTVTTQDFSLLSAPTYVVSGTVTESGTGLPLLAEISFIGSPEVVWTDPATGFYQVALPQGSYTMQVKADIYNPQERAITMDHNQIQNFALDPLPCILLVDDDQNDPDVRSYFTSALNNLAYEYNVWNISAQGDPEEADLNGYQHVLWTTGRPSSNTFTAANEAAVGAYLDAGGNFFLSSHEYLYDFGLTPFGTNYLGITSYLDDVQRSDVIGNAGNPIGDGLGPYTLVMPPGWSSNWSDNVSGPNAPFRWAGTGQNNSVNKVGGTYRTAFIAWPFEGLSSLSARSDVLGSVIEWFGGCQPQPGWLDGHVTDAATGNPLEGVLVTASLGEADIQTFTDPTGYYTMTLPQNTYMVTAALDGYVTQSVSTSVVNEEITTIDFFLEAACIPVTGLDFTWLPQSPFKGDLITFTATASGTEPIDFQWNFGDTFTGAGDTVTHSYTVADTYSVELSASNVCGDELVSKNITILQPGWLDGHVTDADTGSHLEGALVTASLGEADIQTFTDPTGYYTMTLPANTYTVTASLDGYVTQSVSASVVNGEITTIDFSLEAVCIPVTGLDFTWLPQSPFKGDLITFTATTSGTAPIDFQWDFGDTFTSTGGIASHTYTVADTYTVELSASNACGDELVSKEITILQKWIYFIPTVNKN
jgi:PKD repeat protein